MPALIASLLATVLPAAPQVVTEPAPDRPGDRVSTATPGEDFVTLRLADLRHLLRHPKDSGLLSALSLVEARLAELPGEIPNAPPIDPSLVALARELVLGAKTFRLGPRHGANVRAGEMPVYFRLAVHYPTAEGAASFDERIVAQMRAHGAPEMPASEGGLRLVPGAPLPVAFGAHGNDFVIDLGAPEAAPIDMAEPLLPAAARPTCRMTFDYGSWMALVIELMQAEGQGGPSDAEMAMVLAMIERFGLDDLRLEITHGTTESESHTVVRMPGWATWMQEHGLLGTETLTARELALIPPDATWASLGKVEFVALFDHFYGVVIDIMEAQGLAFDPLEMVDEAVGIHLRNDVVGALGNTFGAYASDTTGGGGMMSMVLFASLRDSETALLTREKLEELVNTLASEKMEGYLQMRQWESEGVEYSTMTFPGLPVPIEPTIALTEGWIFVGASPNAARAAVRQSAPGRPNMLDNPELQRQLAGGIAGIRSLSYQDTARLVREGYGAMQMAASALANGVRSRRDLLREAGEVLPPFQELVAGVRPTVSVGRALEGDWVVESRGDASVAVQLAALAGFMQSNGLMLIALPMFVGYTSAAAPAPPIAIPSGPY